MKQVRVKKRDGRTRLIYCVTRWEKHAYRKLLRPLIKIAFACDKWGVSHGCVPLRNPVTNATPHVGYEYTLSFDLTDFFDTVRVHHVAVIDKGVSNKVGAWAVKDMPLFYEARVIETVFVDDAPRQGLPTSPLVANIAASLNIDARIMPLIEGRGIVMTRYVDDISLSTNDMDTVKWLLETIPPLIEAAGFKVNKRKTRVQWAGAGRRIITGVAVDSTGVYPTRAVKRKLRAAAHQGNADSVRGLGEWCKMKLPQKGLLTKRAYNKASKVAREQIPVDQAKGLAAFYAALDFAKETEAIVHGQAE